MKLVKHLINGEVVSMGDPTQDVFNPSTGEVSKQVEVASKNTVEKAITAAQDAFPAWRATPPLKRARIMFRFKELLEKNINKIAQLIGEEHGKIAHDALGEITRGIENVEYACYAPELLKGEHSKNISTNIDSWSEFQPLGVVAGITPFNFPAMVPLWMYPMAIVCGNCFVLKPSERDPSAALFVAQLLNEAGLPKGVLNVVNGGKEAVDTLLTDERVQAVSFVGSTAIAKYIYKTASENDKRCQALGGAKNHAIVMQDAEMENTVNALIGAAFGSSGERCMAISVVVAVGSETADNLIAGLKSKMNDLKVGNFDNSKNDFGPLITKDHMEKVKGYITSAEAQGADIVVDGRSVNVKGCENGFYVGGTLIDCVEASMESYQNEIFGPVLTILGYEDDEDAIRIANDTEYGLSGYVSGEPAHAEKIARQIRSGMVHINGAGPDFSSPFGGYKKSGNGREWGVEGFEEFLETKAMLGAA